MREYFKQPKSKLEEILNELIKIENICDRVYICYTFDGGLTPMQLRDFAMKIKEHIEIVWELHEQVDDDKQERNSDTGCSF